MVGPERPHGMAGRLTCPDALERCIVRRGVKTYSELCQAYANCQLRRGGLASRRIVSLGAVTLGR